MTKDEVVWLEQVARQMQENVRALSPQHSRMPDPLVNLANLAMEVAIKAKEARNAKRS